MKTVIKKISFSFIAALIAAGVLSALFVASAQTPVTLYITSTPGEPGKDVVVSVNISANSGLGAMDFLVNYDSNKLLYKSYKAGAAAEGGMLSVNANYVKQDGSLALKQAFIHPEGADAQGSIMDLTFTVAPGWTGSTAVSIEVIGDIVNAIPPYGKLPYDIKAGMVKIGQASGTGVSTNEAGETVTAQNGNTEETNNTDSSAVAASDANSPDRAEKSSSQKTLIILLACIGVLAGGCAAAYLLVKRKK